VTIINLEMTSPDQLVPGRPALTPLILTEARPDSVAVVRDLYNRIFPSVGGRATWSVTDWTAELTQPGIRTWIAHVDRAPEGSQNPGTPAGSAELAPEPAGFAELAPEPDGSVGIVVFGLVPECRSKGYGAAFLTAITRIAWALNTPTTRVWLQTSTRDHPHALPNYQARGYRPFAP
jgi:GNAT superfamily N-acetyltransferase